MARLAMCPRCRTLHESAGQFALIGISAERALEITHCKLCKTPSSTFAAMEEFAPQLGQYDLGYPVAVVPWFEEVPKRPRKPRATQNGVAPGNTKSDQGCRKSTAMGSRVNPEALRLKQTRRLLGGAKLFKHPAGSRLEVHDALTRGVQRWCLLAFVDGLQPGTASGVLAGLGIGTRTWRLFRQAPHVNMPTDLASRVWLMAETLIAASDALGTKTLAESWMLTPTVGLHGRKPIDLLITTQGAQLVIDLLGRLEYGIHKWYARLELRSSAASKEPS